MHCSNLLVRSHVLRSFLVVASLVASLPVSIVLYVLRTPITWIVFAIGQSFVSAPRASGKVRVSGLRPRVGCAAAADVGNGRPTPRVVDAQPPALRRVWTTEVVHVQPIRQPDEPTNGAPVRPPLPSNAVRSQGADHGPRGLRPGAPPIRGRRRRKTATFGRSARSLTTCAASLQVVSSFSVRRCRWGSLRRAGRRLRGTFLR